jgi:hypothetical protein
MADDAQTEEREELPLAKAAEYLLEECRMILPGIQALFGFQLISVFNQRFAEKLSTGEQRLHLVAIVLVVVAIAFIMTPAAYHRETGGREVTETFLRISTRLVVVSMIALSLGLSIDFYLVGRIIVNGSTVPLVLSVPLFVVFITLWFVLPRWRRLQRLLGR